MIAMVISCVNFSYGLSTNRIEYDNPEITGLEFLADSNLNMDLNQDKLKAKVSIKEESSGVSYICLTFKKDGGSDIVKFDWNAPEMSEEGRLYSGTHTLKFGACHGAAKKTGKYILTNALILDDGDNLTEYSKDEKNFDNPCFKKSISISKFYEEKPQPDRTKKYQQLKSVHFRKTENINAGNNLEVEIELGAQKEKNITTIDFSIEGVGQYSQLEESISTPYLEKGEGKYLVKIPLENKLPVCMFYITSVEVNYFDEYSPSYKYASLNTTKESELFSITKSAHEPYDMIPPALKGIKFDKSTLNAPDVLEATLDIVEEGTGVRYLEFNFTDEDENNIGATLETEQFGTGKPLKTGRHKLKIPVPPYWGDRKLVMSGVRMIDNQGNEKEYSFGSGIIPEKTLTVNSDFDVTYTSNTKNPGAPDKIAKLEEGKTAVIGLRGDGTVSSRYFKAIAGRDVNIIFTDEDVQWVINGNDVDPAKIKDIVLSCELTIVDGNTAGFAGEDKVIKTVFAKNGTLPGPMDVRVYGEYLLAKYSFTEKDLTVTYNKDETMNVENTKGIIQGDQHIQYTLTHNSTFYLSKTKAKLGKVKDVQTKSLGLHKIKVSWKKKKAVSGYYVYMASSAKGTYKKIGTVGKNTTSFTAKNLKAGKKYYFKVKAFSKKNRKLNKTAVMSNYSAKKTCLKSPKIQYVSGAAGRKVLIVDWHEVPGAKGYAVYRSTKKNGTYKKVKYTTRREFTDKNISYNKNYYYKVKAISKNSSYNSYLGTAECGIALNEKVYVTKLK